MNSARLSVLLLATSLLAGCGSSTRPPRVIDGVWNASLQNSDSTVAYTFMVTLNQGSGSTVNVSGFVFTSDAPCFTSPTGQTATFNATGHSGGFQTGPFGMNVSTALGTQVENVLTLTGTRNSDGKISGTWTLTGLSGCSGSGTYTMQAIPPL